jgi:hypothetical protein
MQDRQWYRHQSEVVGVVWQGTWTPLHADVLRSFSWSTNVAGRKRWRLLSPRHTHLLYDRFGRDMAPDFFLASGGGAHLLLVRGSRWQSCFHGSLWERIRVSCALSCLHVHQILSQSMKLRLAHQDR